MKIVFLGIDGVINTPSTEEKAPNGFPLADDNLIETLSKITDDKDVRIVLDSSWRMGWTGRSGKEYIFDVAVEDFEALKEKLSNHGIELFDRTAFSTIVGKSGTIPKWLRENKDLGIDGVVIIDSENVGVEGMGSRTVVTNSEIGITEEDVNKAIGILNEKWEGQVVC